MKLLIILLHYGLTVGIPANKLIINFELLGLAIFTESFDNVDDQFTHSFNLGAVFMGNIFVPKVFYKIYLKKKERELVKNVFGIECSVSL